MPRITYHDRFTALLAKDYLSDRDRNFAESLFSYYQRKGTLTAGRRNAFVNMEERYATRPEPSASEDVISELQTLQGKIESFNPNSWDQSFVISVVQQVVSGRQLSDRQNEILGQIKDRYSDTAIQSFHDFRDTFNDGLREDWRVLMTYYHSLPERYFVKQVTEFFADPENHVPSQRDYERIRNNKYANKILLGWNSEPQWQSGEMVSLRDTAPRLTSKHFPTNLGLVIRSNSRVPQNACVGNKLYEVLPIGGVAPVEIEERYLKNATRKRKKS